MADKQYSAADMVIDTLKIMELNTYLVFREQNDYLFQCIRR